jgi:Sulfotransferase domain
MPRLTPPVRAILRGITRPVRELRDGYRYLTAPRRGWPSALIIGAQRSGTSSLFNYLARHPHVRAPVTKEVHYFDFHFRKPVLWYRGRFPYSRKLRAGALTFEASPYYLAHPLVPGRAARLLPEVKLIALLRNPVDRTLSHYHHEVRGGRESLSFAEAIEREAERLAGEEERLGNDPEYYSFNHHRYSYTTRGLYLQQLRRWMVHYPRGQLLVLQSEWLFRDPAAATAAVHDFLGLGPFRLPSYRPYYGGHYERAMPEELRAKLVRYFAPHNCELFQWLGEHYDWS